MSDATLTDITTKTLGRPLMRSGTSPHPHPLAIPVAPSCEPSEGSDNTNDKDTEA